MPIQGTAADMLKIAMIDIDAEIRNNKLNGAMILQVHDELVFDIHESDYDVWEKMVRTSMENVLMHHAPKHGILGDKLPPIRVDIHKGSNWTLAKG